MTGAARATEAGGSERATAVTTRQRTAAVSAADGGGSGAGGERRRERCGRRSWRRTTTGAARSAEAGGSKRVTAATKPFLRVRGDNEALHRRPLYRLVSHLGTLTGGATLFTPPPLIPSSLPSTLKRASRKSALEAGDGKPEPGATLVVVRQVPPARRALFPRNWHDGRSRAVRG
uniref:Uncharacterized protein n=1 Tax=Oryza meridionalis TaxID=40149 RepID=A0A0E0DQ45_9ORYZ